MNDSCEWALTDNPDVGGGGDCEDEEESDKGQRLQVVGSDRFHTEHDGLEQTALTSTQARSQHETRTPTVRGCITTKVTVIIALKVGHKVSN